MDSFTAQDWILIIGAVGIVVNNMISNWKMSAKVDTINQTAKVIEGHVNSSTTKADERATAAADREKALLETISELKKSSALLAQALAIKEAGRTVRSADVQQVMVPAVTAAVVAPIVGAKKLQEIADNTAETVQAVKDLGEKK